MKKSILKPACTVILQMMAHQEIECVVDDKGNVYVKYPMPAGAVSTAATTDDEEEPVKKAPAATSGKSVKPAAEPKVVSKSYTKEDLMELETEKLEEIIEAAGYKVPKEGKNTHKKLRDVILENQSEEAPEAEEEEAPKKPAAGKGKVSPIAEDVTEVLEKLDSGKFKEEEAVKALVKLGDDVDKKAVTKLVDKMMADSETPIADYVKQFVAAIEGGAAEEEEEPAPTRRGAKAAAEPKKELIKDFEDLEVDDKIEAYFDDLDDTFKGTVISVGRKGVMVLWEDGDKLELDEENNTTVYRLA